MPKRRTASPRRSPRRSPRTHAPLVGGSASCAAAGGIPGCGGGAPADTHLDPVSDPAYNMVNVLKQSILLEEHLSNDSKYCTDCVAKHFLHIVGLVEEALGLAGKHVGEYPHLEPSAEFYRGAFGAWRAHKADKRVRHEVADALRQHRKLLQAEYI